MGPSEDRTSVHLVDLHSCVKPTSNSSNNNNYHNNNIVMSNSNSNQTQIQTQTRPSSTVMITNRTNGNGKDKEGFEKAGRKWNVVQVISARPSSQRISHWNFALARLLLGCLVLFQLLCFSISLLARSETGPELIGSPLPLMMLHQYQFGHHHHHSQPQISQHPGEQLVL